MMASGCHVPDPAEIITSFGEKDFDHGPETNPSEMRLLEHPLAGLHRSISFAMKYDDMRRIVAARHHPVRDLSEAMTIGVRPKIDREVIIPSDCGPFPAFNRVPSQRLAFPQLKSFAGRLIHPPESTLCWLESTRA